MDLYVLRHGEAGESVPNANKDRERELTQAGAKEVTSVAETMAKLGLKLDMIFSSPLPRAKETAEIVARTRKKIKVQLWDELSPEGDKKAMLARLARVGHEEKVLIVGHEPYLTQLVGDLIGSRPEQILLKKAGLIRLRVTSFSPKATGELRWLLTPRVMKALL